MRILTVVHDLGPGGTQRAAQNYSFGYRQAGLKVAVLAYAQGGSREAELREAGIDVFSPNAETDALRAAAAWCADVVHIHRNGSADAQSGEVLRTLRAGGSTPRVIETNVFGRVDRSEDRHLIDVHLHLSRWCLWRWQRWHRRMTGAPGVVVPYAVDTERFFPLSAGERREARERWGLPQDALVFGRIGQPSEWKWHPALYRAFEQIAARHANAWLFLVGLPGPHRRYVERLPEPIRRRVVTLPFLHGDEALRQGYAAMDVFAHAAEIGESFGMVLGEAMRCARPVVTLSRPARDNSQLEVVRHGVGGLVAAHGQGFAEAMERFAREPELCAALGISASESVAARFGLQAVMRLLLPVAEAAGTSASPALLRQRLADVPGLVTRVTDVEISALLRAQIGRTPAVERAQMALAHQPLLHAAVARVKRWRYRRWRHPDLAGATSEKVAVPPQDPA